MSIFNSVYKVEEPIILALSTEQSEPLQVPAPLLSGDTP